MLRLYLDEDSMSHSLIRALRARGVDVVTALEAGMIERSDADHLEFATSQERVLCTFNVGDFYRLHTDWLTVGKDHGGIIFVPQQRYAIGELLRRLLKLASTRSTEAMRGQAEFLSAWG
jgi:Domain of unknown function (DUF5615)